MIAERLRLCALAVALCSGAAHAATITIVNQDAAGEGFNDPTPATPVDGNPGTTRGAQRLYVFQHAAEKWGRILKSDVEIKVNGSMPSLSGCGTTTVMLGQAGPEGSAANFANAPRTNRAYASAQANSLAGSDLDPGKNDLLARFNAGVDSGNCIQGTVGWWYGVKDPNLVPTDRLPLLPVVFHEIGHGLGFTSQVGFILGFPIVGTSHTPIWFDYLYDLEEAKHWSAMSSFNNSLTNDPNVVWTGTNVNRYQRSFLKAPLVGRANSPAAIAGEFGSLQPAQFGPPLGQNGLTGNVVMVNDGVAGAAQGGFPAGTNTDGCEPLANASAVAGKIALIDRGFCNFPDKVKNAQNAGAVGVIVANTADNAFPAGMGGLDPTITIPSVGVNKAQGTTLRNNLTGLNVTLGTGAGVAGTQGGCVRIFAPDPVMAGSSGSHFHSDAYPNVLMEPALNRSLFDQVDLTVELFRDIGWKTERDDSLFADWFDGNPCPVGPAP